MDLSKINLPELRAALKHATATDPLKARLDCICSLIVTNFSRVGGGRQYDAHRGPAGEKSGPRLFFCGGNSKVVAFLSLSLSLLNNILSFVSFLVLLGNVLHTV